MAKEIKAFCQKNENKIFWMILILAVILRFWNITTYDIIGDVDLYAFRALGWFDFLGGGQTTPVQWFGNIPGWANLSFHDAPPLVMYIERLFFLILGDNTFAVRLPSVLAGMALVLAVYYFLQSNKDKISAWLSMLLIAICSCAILVSLNGLLEGYEAAFFVWCWFFFFKYLKKEKPQDLYYCAALAGCALISKYLAFFISPSFMVFIVLYKREWLVQKDKWRQFAIAGLLFLFVISPAIIYNAMVFKYRGHFDASLSSMVGMHPQDFSVIAARSLDFNLLNNLIDLPNIYLTLESVPFLILAALALIYFLWRCLNRDLLKPTLLLEKFMLLNFLFMTLMFCASGVRTRWLSVYDPIFAVMIGIFVADCWNYLRAKPVWIRYAGIAVFGALMFGELLYCINTNILIKPVGSFPFYFTEGRLYAEGYNELEIYWRDNLFPSLPKIKRPTSMEDAGLTSADLAGRNLIFYDDTVNWSLYVWYIQKYQMYYRLPVLPVSYLFNNTSLMDQADKLGVRGVYYVAVVNPMALDTVVVKNEQLMQAISKLRQDLDGAKIIPAEIRNPAGDVSFLIYKIK